MSSKELQERWPFCKIELGLSRAEFDQLTVRTFLEMFQLWEAKKEREDRRVARICMCIAMTVPRKEGPNFTEDDFMPKAVSEDTAGMTDEQIYQAFSKFSQSRGIQT